MKKQVFLRSLLGAFVGCFIGVVIIICISLAIGGGDMHVATPALLAQVGSEVGAFSLQMAAAMLIGAIWSGASVIWEVERWSLSLYIQQKKTFRMPPDRAGRRSAVRTGGSRKIRGRR